MTHQDALLQNIRNSVRQEVRATAKTCVIPPLIAVTVWHCPFCTVLLPQEFKREGGVGGVTTAVRTPSMSGDGEDPYVSCCALATALPTPGAGGL